MSSHNTVFFFLAGFFLVTILVTKGVFLQTDQYIDQILPYSKTGIFYYVSKTLAFLYLPVTGVILALMRHFIRKKQKEEAVMLAVTFSG